MSKYNNGFSTVDTLSIKTLSSKFRNDRMFLRPILKDGRRTFQRLPHKKRDWKIYLIHSILQGATLPPIYIYEDTNDEAVVHIVDGQQRLSAIFEFMQGGLKLTKAGMLKQGLEELPDELDGATWDDLTPDQQKIFLDFSLRVEKINDPDQKGFDNLVRLEFHRLNSTNGTMTAMEIWNNSYNGDFVDLLYRIKEDLGFVSPGARDLSVSKNALKEYALLNDKVVSRTEVLRLQDLDLILGLLAAMIKEGPQHKDEGIDELCLKHKVMDKKTSEKYFSDFMENIHIIQEIGNNLPLGLEFKGTELRKKHDYYSLFCAVDQMRRENGLSSGDALSTIAHNLYVFNLALRSYSESVQGTKKTVKEWSKLNLSQKLRTDIPDYYNSRTRDWNHDKSRVTRMNAILDIMGRSNCITTP